MAIIQCKECSKDVSDTAVKCPNCGIQLNKPKRSTIGKIIKWLFIGFNMLMIYWLFAGVGASADVANHASSEAAKAGAAIGTGLGAMMILFLWAIGDIILGLLVMFTRPKS
ncbi:MAG: hypothetical protein ACRCV6_01325 [Formosimonas sp.]